MPRVTAATWSSPWSSSGRPLTATANPSRASRRAISAPRPRELPVTRATRPCVDAAGSWRPPLAGAEEVEDAPGEQPGGQRLDGPGAAGEHLAREADLL